MPQDRTGQHAAFDVAALADQIFGRIAVADALDILLDNRAFIEIGRHIMGRGPDQFHPAPVCLVIGPRALEAGQERFFAIARAPKNNSAPTNKILPPMSGL